jgi:hypothetical protein
MTSLIEATNPRAEAQGLLPAGYEARILEPSPPADTDPDWYADDPTDPGNPEGELVTPIPKEGTTWSDIASGQANIQRYISDHWWSGNRRLEPLPAGFDTTRRSLHQLAFFAVAPRRYAATGKLGLRYTHRGFGTPFFAADEQVRVESGRLAYQRGHEVDSIVPGNLGEACEFLGVPYRETWFEDFHDPLAPIGPTADLHVDTESANALGDWFGFATLALERARRMRGAADVSRVQLWPEHFDPAVEIGSHEEGRRASYGASPGDDAHPEPYLYVAAWSEIDRADPFWNDTTFNGASLPYSDILDSDDQLDAALFFFRRAHARLDEKVA